MQRTLICCRVSESYIVRTSNDNLDNDNDILMRSLKIVAYLLRWIAIKYFNDNTYVSEDADIAVEEENDGPPIVVQRRPISRYLRANCQRIIVEQYH